MRFLKGFTFFVTPAFFISAAIADQSRNLAPSLNVVLQNEFLRFGSGSQDSVSGDHCLLEQPFLQFDGDFYEGQLPLESAYAVNGDGGDLWNADGAILAPLDGFPASNVQINYDGFIETSSNVNSRFGYGTINATCEWTIDSSTIRVTHKYTLASSTSIAVQIKTTITNVGAGPITNLRAWFGGGDDYVLERDTPAKFRALVSEQGISPTTVVSERSNTLMLAGEALMAVFFSPDPTAHAVIAGCCSMSNVALQNPLTGPTQSFGSDASYGMYLRFDDLGIGSSASVDWYYAAGDLMEVVEEFNLLLPPSASPSPSPSASPSSSPSSTLSGSPSPSPSATSSGSTSPSPSPTSSGSPSPSPSPSPSASTPPPAGAARSSGKLWVAGLMSVSLTAVIAGIIIIFCCSGPIARRRADNAHRVQKVA